MQIDPGAYIAELLYENDTVSLPGFGSFVKAYKGANIDYVQGEIKPPASALNFNSNLVVNDGLLVRFLKKKHGLPISKAEQVVKDYVSDLKQKLENKEFVTFSGLGRLYKDFEGNFKFLPESTNFNTDSFGLPDLQFYPIARPFSETGKSTVMTTPPTKSETVSNSIADWFANNLLWIGLAVVLVVFTTIYLTMFRNKGDQNNQVSGLEQERLNVSPGDSEGDYEIVDDFYDDEDAPIASDDLPPADPPEEVDTEAPTLSPREKVAVIIIGKFGKQSNVDKLVKRIYEAGYEPYTDKEGSLTVVGVQMVYEEDSKVYSTLEKVRNKFEPDAEILRMGKEK